jgi:hypothetical protein
VDFVAFQIGSLRGPSELHATGKQGLVQLPLRKLGLHSIRDDVFSGPAGKKEQHPSNIASLVRPALAPTCHLQ